MKKFFVIILFCALLIAVDASAADKQPRSTEVQKSSLDPVQGSEGSPLSEIEGITSTVVIQNLSFAHLEIISGTAHIHAGLTHPISMTEGVRIDWSLYAWNSGWLTKDILVENVITYGIGTVEVNAALEVPDYDYYFLECKNKLFEAGAWVPKNISVSRYGKIAPRNGVWERTGEVTSSSAILHTYLTEKPPFDATDPENLRVPPMGGYAQFVVYLDPDLLVKVTESGFYPVDDYINSDEEWRRVFYNFRWTVTGLNPDTIYYYRVETKSSDGLNFRTAANVNSFRTAPLSDADQPVSFVVVHCLDAYNTVYTDTQIGLERGLKVFDSMLTYDEDVPDFVIMQGDTVYYDGGYSPDIGPLARSSYDWRWLYWAAQYQFSNFMNFYQSIPGYWMVDDHDYWVNNVNDRRPDGWYIFRNANPTPGTYGTTGEDAISYYNDNPYGTSQGDGSHFWRSVRWGQHLELFFEEGRNHRDFDAGLIWSDEQREWLADRILESSATYKIIMASTPLLGPLIPDDTYPSVIPDKHANQKFRTETELFLNNIRGVENIFIIAGDRHYKYKSTINAENFPELSGYMEFGSGSAAAPPHAIHGDVPDSDFANLVFSDGAAGFGPSAGYLRVYVTPFDDRVELTIQLIRVTAEEDNFVNFEETFTYYYYGETSTYLPMIIMP